MKSFALSQRDRQVDGKAGDTKETLVSFLVDLDNLPPLTEEEKSRLEKLANRSDDEINYSDIPPLTEEYWENAVPLRSVMHSRAGKVVRIDEDIYNWLCTENCSPRAKVEEILRREMNAQNALAPGTSSLKKPPEPQTLFRASIRTCLP